MKKLKAAVGALLMLAVAGLVDPAIAQSDNGTSFSGVVIPRGTLNASVTIATGNTFQSVLSSILGVTTAQGAPAQRQSLTIENNNTSDNCWLYIGATASATKAFSILLLPGGSYTRYWPFVPSDNIAATCATTSDTMYVDYQ